MSEIELQPKKSQLPPSGGLNAVPHAPSLLEVAAPDRHRKISYSKQSRTNLHEVRAQSRTFRHAQIIRRPRALQYKSADNANQISATSTHSSNKSTSSPEAGNKAGADAEERSTDNLAKQRSRLDLFVDLIWVGIISNLSGTFGEQAFTDSGVDLSYAVLEFVLLFLVIWRIWDNLRSFTSHYYVDDALQRNFLMWILILVILYGINAPFAFTPDGESNSLTLLICICLVSKVSFLAALLLQTVFIRWLKRQFLFQLGATIITSVFWIAAIFTSYPSKLVFMVLANAIENPIAIFLASPTADRLLIKGLERTPDVDYYVERYESFFIIILGEGVFRLIDGSPSGMGLNSATGTVITALVLYYLLHWLYFNGDQSKEFVHAIRRTWWKPVLWQLFHIFMFAALLILDASTLFLVEHRNSSNFQESSGSTDSSDSESVSEEGHFILSALWTASISLAVALLSMTCIALLNRSLDPPKTLVINSRLVRLAPRLPALALIICLPLIQGLGGALWCGAAVGILYAVFFWEWIGGLEKDWRFFEPKEEATNE